MCKFSIIIPCYNSENNIDKLFDMMWTSDYTDYEVIYVDDCSKDNTFEKMQGLKEKYPNYTVVRAEKNGGPGLARNLGLELAKGEYILFCDSDDEFDIKCLNSIECFINTQPDMDMLVFPYISKKSNSCSISDSYSAYEDKQKVEKVDIVNGSLTPFSKLFKTSIIRENNITFPARMTGEDACFVVNYVVQVKTAFKLNLPYYTYVATPGSITHSHKFDENLPTTFEILQPIYHEYFPEIEITKFVNSHLLTRAKQMTNSKCSAKQIKEFFERENKRFPGWINHIDYENQSLYRKMVYKSMYKNKPYLIKLVMGLRRLLY